jgi:hypothetical protein
MPQGNDGGHDIPETPWVVIPYWTGDLGRKTIERPLPPAPAPGSAVFPGVLSYLCNSIEVLGGAPGVFTPGAPTTVAVTVRNYGRGYGVDLLNLDLWWSAPTTDFGVLTQKPPMAQAVATLGRDGLAKEPPLVQNMTFTTPADSGPHVCLVVRVTAGYPILPIDPSTSDGAPVWPADPTGDRHWAQHNLHAVVATSGGKFHLNFSSANPTARELPFLIRATPVGGRAMEMLAREVQATPRAAEGVSLSVRPVLVRRKEEDEGAGTRAEAPVTIGANRRLQMVLEGQLKEQLGAGEFVAFEVAQLNAGEAPKSKQGDAAKNERGAAAVGRMGSIGVVVYGAQQG